MLRKWLADWERIGRSKKRIYRRQRLQFKQSPKQAEVLEDRTLLSTFYVDNAADYVITNDQGASGLDNGDTVTWDAAETHAAGPVTDLIFGTDAFARIQPAVDAAASSIDATDTINVAAGTFLGTVSINTNVDLIGTIGTIVDGNDDGGVIAPGSVFEIGIGFTVTMSSMTIQNGRSGFGGGIENEGNLTLNSVLVQNNTATTGGGVFNSETGTLMVQNGSTITGNSAGTGGGIRNLGTATIQGDSSITNNSADLRGGGIRNGGELNLSSSIISLNSASTFGGGIDNEGVLTVEGSTVEANSGSSNGGGISNSGTATIQGGTIISSNSATSGGGIENSSDLTIGDSIVESNVANGFAGGGGVFNSGSLSVNGSTIDGNQALGTASNSGGGGIRNDGIGATLTATGTTITQNNSASNGGGIYNRAGTVTIQGESLVSQNAAQRSGGALRNGEGGSATIRGRTIVNGNSAGLGGGGIQNGGTLFLEDSTVENNSARRSGGGIVNSGPGVVMVDRSTIIANTVDREAELAFGGGIANHGTATIRGGSMIAGNSASVRGGGLWNGSAATTTISETVFHGNTASGSAMDDGGGGIFNNGGTVNISQSTISNNTADVGGGGGIFNDGTFSTTDTTISSNRSFGDGGGVLNNGILDLSQVTVSGNRQSGADAGGGGIYNTGDATISNSTITANFGVNGGLGNDVSGTVTLNSSIIAGNTFGGFVLPPPPSPDVVGNIDPFSSFNLIGDGSSLSGIVDGSNGNQIGTFTNPIDARLAPLADNGGTTLTHALLPGSPAINSGNNLLNLQFDQRGMPFIREFGSGVDLQQTDVGAFELQGANGRGNAILALSRGPGAPGIVRALNGITREELFVVTPYPGFKGGIRVAIGDVNGDMTPDVITGAGEGGGPHIKVYDGTNGQQLSGPSGEFFAFAMGFNGGVFVASGDVDDDGSDDIIVGAGPGGGPHVRVFSGKDGSEQFSFFAYDFGFAGGVSVGAGDITDDGIDDIITGAGPGAGPHVRVFEGTNPQIGGVLGVDAGGPLGNFFAYDEGFRGGVFVASADVDGNGRDDLITGAGVGGGPHVKVFDADTGTKLPGSIGSFFAFAADFTGGVRVTAIDVTGDELADIIVGSGPTGGPDARIFDGSSGVLLDTFQVGGDPNFPGGVFVGATGSSLRLAAGTEVQADAQTLSLEDVGPVFEAALARLESVGLSTDVVQTLSLTTMEVVDLEGDALGESTPGLIRLDVNAAGAGWFIDATPGSDEEFAGDSLTVISTQAAGGVDLLTVVLHELAHELGGGHLLAETLPPGQRRLPDQDALDALFASSNDWFGLSQ